MDRQEEFAGMPERTELGKKAIEFMNKKDEIEARKKELDQIKLQLGMLFGASDQDSIKIENRIVSYSLSEKERITVKTVAK